MTLKTPSWGPMCPLAHYLKAPATAGVYEIGFRKDGYMAPQSAAFGLHAVSYPTGFYPMYVGKHQRSLRKRLGEHFIGINSEGRTRRGSKASKSIKNYYQSILPNLLAMSDKIPRELLFPLDGLFFTCMPLQEPGKFESLVRLSHFDYPWNRRDEGQARTQASNTESLDFGYIYREKAVQFIG
ncbi:hypothetical protein MO867_12910 [Microbulbifer sp. OS29]|uniref:Uncharacterized protein n=1 Tax=Microbulbifer okhotskensis TaxID=2926617 RepID=A0A9X2J5I4_9GAMM|nr:hypothetical protein [Microbulbifer okhotskensis]MCO1335233.1 hypothetical protein [Microbulbifer okhotskensis]